MTVPNYLVQVVYSHVSLSAFNIFFILCLKILSIRALKFRASDIFPIKNLAQGTEVDKSEIAQWFTDNQLDLEMGKVVVSICLYHSLVVEMLLRDPISSFVSLFFALHICLFQVKPAKAGSSIGVKVAFGVNDSIKKAIELILEVYFVLSLG